MPTVDVEKEVYTFSELSDEAKQRARDTYKEAEGEEFGAFGELLESAETAAKLLGLEFNTTEVSLHGGKTRQKPDIAYSGFWSQGDGLSFSGSYKFIPGCSDKVREEFGTDTVIHGIADRLTALHCTLRLLKGEWLTGTITRDKCAHYVHKMTMDATATDKDGEEMDETICKDFLELMRDFADWIYNGLEEEYNYRTSDESADQYLMDSDDEFDEDGDRI